MSFQNPILKNLSDIYNPYTLNIFSDASTRVCRGGRTAGCYGVIAVCMDNIIYSYYRIHSDTTSNAEEARGVAGALSLALSYRYNFKNINIFSDSKISIIGIRDFASKWYYEDNNLYRKKYGSALVSNQNIFTEMYMSAIELLKTNQLGLYHIKGHVNLEAHAKTLDRQIHNAYNVFMRENKMYNQFDMNIIRYLCTYNSFVDHGSRSLLYRTNVQDNLDYRDAVEFYPTQPLIL